ncbi:uncharacterized protein EAE97_001283 [Botrytis byssoidea]|uniref:Uncharacterized protein n=1 Tax=Botrytis byssoidea TaxID=139641 RepID=A0A9P5IX95_9HELO|nr:uncharacterized protein EAE97_001283 [Botrytis byssoidea]KAF7953884.1 hypothetical protein EAE97_001283 [Botrytis byssoidea]
MDIITVVHPNPSSPTGNRNPLMPRTTSPQQTPAHNIRRKGSFIRAIPDSSEDSPPSTDNSIFEAFLFSKSNSEDSVHNKSDTLPRSKQAACEISPSNDENMKQTSISTKPESTMTEFLYGHGTVLDTITEQKSYGTMRSITRTKSADDISTIRSVARTKSADGISTSPLLGHRDSFTIAKNRPRHKQSFSLDDIWCIKDSYHDACAMTDQAARRRLSIREVYAKPKEPLLAPPERPDTPPGCPSWTEAQRPGPRQHLIPHHTRLQRLLRMPSSGLTLSPTPARSFFTGRVVSAPGLTRLPPRFRAPRSVYSAIDTHPFSNAPVHKIDPEPPIEAPRPIVAPILSHHPRTSSLPSAAPLTSANQTTKGKGKAKSKFVRFTPSATARDSEMFNLQHAIEATSSTALHPLVDHSSNFNSMPLNTPRCPHRKGRRQAMDEVNRTFNSPIDTYQVPRSNQYLPLPSVSTLPKLQVPSIRGLRSTGDSAVSLHTSTYSGERHPTSIDINHGPNRDNDAIRRVSLSPSLISDINAEFPNTNRDDVDLGIIDLEHENRTSSYTRSPGTPLTSRSASANMSANTSGYFMTGALHIPHVESGEQQALNVPILTGARMMNVWSPGLRMGGDGYGTGISVRDFGSAARAEDKKDIDESLCWKCKVIGAKRKLEDWIDRGCDWACFVCCGGWEEGLEEERGGVANQREAERRRRIVLGGIPGVGI